MSRCLLFLALSACGGAVTAAKTCAEEDGGIDPDAAQIAYDACMADDSGAVCESTTWIGETAALCYAEAAGVDEARGRTAELWYDGSARKVVWHVQNTVADAPDGGMGRYVVLNAVGGAVIDDGTWEDEGEDGCRGCGDSGS